MKWNKILALLLVIAMAMTMLVACGGKDDDDKKDNSDKTEASESVKDDDKKDEDKDEVPETLTEEYLIGTWVAEVDAVEAGLVEGDLGSVISGGEKYNLKELGFECTSIYEIVFEKDGKMVLTCKGEVDLKKFEEKLKKNEEFISVYFNTTKEEIEAYAKEEWMTYEEVVDQLFENAAISPFEVLEVEDFESFEETDDSLEYTFDGKTLTIDGETERYSYENGVLKFKSLSSDDLTLEFKKK